jgi:hypothetical protein
MKKYGTGKILRDEQEKPAEGWTPDDDVELRKENTTSDEESK